MSQAANATYTAADIAGKVSATYLWVAIGVGGVLVVLLAVFVIYYGYRSYGLERKVRDLETQALDRVEQIPRENSESAMEMNDVHFIEDRQLPIPVAVGVVANNQRPMAIGQTEIKERIQVIQTDGHPPQTRYQQETTRRTMEDDREDGLPPYRPAEARLQRQSQAPARSRYDQEMDNYRHVLSQRRNDIETASNHIPRPDNRLVRPRRTNSMDRIDERVAPLNRNQPFSYINNQPLSRGFPLAGRVSRQDGPARSGSADVRNNVDNWEDQEDRRPQQQRRARSPAAYSDRGFDRNTQVRQSRSWDDLERSQKRPIARDQYGRPLN